MPCPQFRGCPVPLFVGINTHSLAACALFTLSLTRPPALPHPHSPTPRVCYVQLDAISLPLFVGIHTFTLSAPFYRGIRALPLWIHVQWYLGVLPLLALKLLAPAW